MKSPGTVIGGEFVILRSLGAGGMGAVYVAQQKSTGVHRALKVMHPDLVGGEKARERFEQEARVGAQIASDYVVKVIGAGVDGPSRSPWLAMELLEGEDLAAAVKRRGPVPPREAASILRQICHAVGAAHARGIVHRDLKPENVFLARTHRLDESSTVKVLDFGIAKIVAEASTSLTDAVGTPLWMAPEQTESTGVSPATDVWAIGLLSFWLLTGKAYWKTAHSPGSGVAALMRELVLDALVPASERARELGVARLLPEGFDTWFDRCVSREPASRYQNAAIAISALEPLLVDDILPFAETAASGAIQQAARHSPVPAPTVDDIAPIAAGSTNAAVAGLSTPGAQPLTTTTGQHWSGTTRFSAPPQRSPAMWLVAGGSLVLLLGGIIAIVAVTIFLDSDLGQGALGPSSDRTSEPTGPISATATALPTAAAVPTSNEPPVTTPKPDEPEKIPDPVRKSLGRPVAKPKDAPPSTTHAPPSKPGVDPASPPPSSKRPFPRAEARAALDRAAAAASQCPAPSTTVRATVSWTGKTGAARSVGLSQFSGTPIATCIRGHFMRTNIGPYFGSGPSLSKEFAVGR